MLLGERAVLDVQPSYGFRHKDCKMRPPPGLRPEEPLTVDVQVGSPRGRAQPDVLQGSCQLQPMCAPGVRMLQSKGLAWQRRRSSIALRLPAPQLVGWQPGVKAKPAGPEHEIVKRVLAEGEGWETPRPPFEVEAHITLRLLHTAGRAEEGRQYYSTAGGRPLAAVMGAAELPRGGRRGWCGRGTGAGCGGCLKCPGGRQSACVWGVVPLSAPARSVPGAQPCSKHYPAAPAISASLRRIPACAAGVELALQSMARGEEALALFPAELAAGCGRVPGPPAEAVEGESAWVEARLQLLDYTQARGAGPGAARAVVGWAAFPALAACCPCGSCRRAAGV